MATQTDAAVFSSSAVNDDPLFFDSGITPSLVTTGQSSLVSINGTTPSLGFPLGGVNNGSAVGSSGGTMDINTLTFFDNLNAGSATVTFQLDQAYDITGIASLAGWGDTYFGSQLFSVLLETSNSGIFNSIGNFGVTPYTPPVPDGFPGVVDHGFATLTTITDDDTGIIASNVTGIRLVYSDPYPTIGSLNGTVIREISVNGVASVPEPASTLLFALGGMAAFSRRRRIARVS